MFKQIFFSVLFVLVSYLSFAQPSQYTPMTAAGYQFKRILTDSTLHIPSFCGTPNLRNSTAKNGALAIDTCNNKLYTWTHGAGWTDISSGGIDTTSLSNRINLKLNISDTATMLSKYLRKTDTTAMLSKYLRKTDTTAMLQPYLKKSDTAAMLTPYAKFIDVALKLNISDTATMLSKYLRKTDTTAMLSKYLRKSDTTNKWVQSVTKLNDSTIVVTKNGTATNIVLPRGGASSTPTLQQVTTAGATTGDVITLDWTNAGFFITEMNKILTPALTNYYPFYFTNTLNGGLAYIQHPEAVANSSGNTYEYFNGVTSSDHVKINQQLIEMSGDAGSGKNVQIIPTYGNDDTHYLPISDAVTDTLATLADIRNGGGSSSYVPYTGATADVDLGTHILNAHAIAIKGTNGNGHIDLRHQVSDATATGQSTALFADNNGDLKWKNDGNYYTTLKTSTNTADRVYTFPNATTTLIGASDTSTMLTNYAKNSAVNLKVNISDTASMLTNYAKTSAVNTKLAITDTSVFQRKNIAAYSFQANNTNAAANTTDQYFRDVSGTYSGTPVWTATTAPTTGNHSYRWTRIGKMVNLNVTLFYTNAGSVCTQVIIPLPTDAPTPAEPSGVGAATEFIYPVTSSINTSATAIPTLLTRGFLRANAADNGYELILNIATGNSAKVVYANVTYWTN